MKTITNELINEGIVQDTNEWHNEYNRRVGLEKIKIAYKEVNDKIKGELNNASTRKLIKESFKELLVGIDVICDETNNPPDIIDKNIGMARVKYNFDYDNMKYDYIDLTFGEPTNELFKTLYPIINNN